MTTFGVDVSHHQGGLKLAAVKATGCRFVYAKASEGATYRDPMFWDWQRAAERLGLLFAAYHFVSDRAADEQAANYAAAVPDKSIPVVLDVEPGASARPSIGLAERVRSELERRGYRVTLVYLPGWYAAQLGATKLPDGWRVIQSRYPSTRAGGHRELYPGDDHEAWGQPVAGRLPVLWQFASSARFPGHSGSVDVNAFRGTRDELAANGWFKNYGEAPQGPAKPDPVPVPVPETEPEEPLDSFLAITWNPFAGTPRAEVEPILDAQLERGVSLVFGQEMSRDWWPELLRSRGLRVQFAAPQYVVAWDPAPWTRIDGGDVRLSGQAYAGKGIDEQYSEAAWSLLCDVKGRSLDAVSYHTPSGVQVAEANRPERRLLATLESFAYLGERAVESEATAVLYAGDDNVDETQGIGASERLWAPMQAGATGLRVVRAPAPTHGKRRRIDDFRALRHGRLKPGEGWVFAGGGDHRGHGRRFYWRRRRV